MLINKHVALGEHRHNFARLALVMSAFALFIVHVIVQRVVESGSIPIPDNSTRRLLGRLVIDIKPTVWTFKILNLLNILWQFGWLLYSLTFINRRSSTGYLYLSSNTFTPLFYLTYIAAFGIQSVWIFFFQNQYYPWAWLIYLISFLLLSFAWLGITNNIANNKKLFETEGFTRDISYLRFLTQNGLAFFACYTAARFVVSLDIFLQVGVGINMTDAGTIALIVAGIIAVLFFVGPNVTTAMVEECAYLFAPWVAFIIFFSGVVDNNWIPKNIRRNVIIAAVELGASVVSAVAALALFILRYRASKIDPIA